MSKRKRIFTFDFSLAYRPDFPIVRIVRIEDRTRDITSGDYKATKRTIARLEKAVIARRGY